MSKGWAVFGVLLSLAIAIVSILIATDVIHIDKTTGSTETPPAEQELTYEELMSLYAQLQQDYDTLQGNYNNDISYYEQQLEDMQLSYDDLQNAYNQLEDDYYSYLSSHPDIYVPTYFEPIVIDLWGYSFGGGQVGNEGDYLKIELGGGTVPPTENAIGYSYTYRGDTYSSTTPLYENTRASNLVEYVDTTTNTVIRIIATSENYIVEFCGTIGDKTVNVVFESVEVVETEAPSIDLPSDDDNEETVITNVV